MFDKDMRNPAVEGQFYPSNPDELKKIIKEYLKKPKYKARFPLGIIAPHAGYEFSGQTAAYSYKAISDQKFDTFVILGTNHSGPDTVLSMQDFKTSLGILKNDEEFSKELADMKVEVNEREHSFEHSIEVQLPFIQTMFEDAKIVPILASFPDFEEAKKLGEKIAAAAKKLKRKVCVIASGDFTHYGESYNYLPFAPDKHTRRKVYAIDKKAIDMIAELKGKEFFEYSKDKTICGISSITAAIEACRKMGARKAKLLDYSNSGGISKDYENCVSYASIVLEK